MNVFVARLEGLASGGVGLFVENAGEECGEVGLEAKAGAGGVGNGRWGGGSWGGVLDEDIDEVGLCRRMGRLLVALGGKWKVGFVTRD